jgi:hypothetical protein
MFKAAGIVLILLALCCGNVYSQARKYLYFGLEVENYADVTPLKRIIDDYNIYHTSNDISTAQQLTLPIYINGFMVGTKIHSRFCEFGGNVHFNNYSMMAQGELAGGTEYYEKLILSHNGFHLHWRVLLINTNFFRTGPGVGFKIEQFRVKLNYNEDPSINTMVPANKALFSGQLIYNISIGGPKFNLDIGAYYQIPFWDVNLSNLNTKLNLGFATDYPASEMAFKSVTYGVYLTIGLGSKENFDF